MIQDVYPESHIPDHPGIRILNTAKSSKKQSVSPVTILGQQIALDSLHEIVEPGHHGPALVQRLGRDNLVAKVLEVLLVEQDEPE